MSCLPTSYHIEDTNNIVNFTYDQIVSALYKYLENKHNTKFNLQVLEVESDLNYTKYTILFIDKTFRGINKPTFEEKETLYHKDIKKLLKI